MNIARNQPLRAVADKSLITHIALVLLGSWAIAMAARINIPMLPVPMSLQTLAVLLIATLSGKNMATQVVGAYLIQGAAGLPMFVGGAGLAYMAGPTGGYLAGFLVAAFLVGWLSDKGWNQHIGRLTLSVFAGHAVILGLGVLWLQNFTGWSAAFTSGVFPFIVGMLVKTLVIVAVVTKLPVGGKAN